MAYVCVCLCCHLCRMYVFHVLTDFPYGPVVGDQPGLLVAWAMPCSQKPVESVTF
jgi:hypothetical protein